VGDRNTMRPERRPTRRPTCRWIASLESFCACSESLVTLGKCQHEAKSDGMSLPASSRWPKDCRKMLAIGFPRNSMANIGQRLFQPKLMRL
jgi:hypothetical protein